MAITIEAVVENGMLRPIQPLPLKENEQVRVTIEKRSDWIQRTYGMCGWKGDSKELERLAMSPEFDLGEEP
jgi:predicted DNA-binding antitoxin AbrB/MazE fold protein